MFYTTHYLEINLLYLFAGVILLFWAGYQLNNISVQFMKKNARKYILHRQFLAGLIMKEDHKVEKMS